MGIFNFPQRTWKPSDDNECNLRLRLVQIISCNISVSHKRFSFSKIGDFTIVILVLLWVKIGNKVKIALIVKVLMSSYAQNTILRLRIQFNCEFITNWKWHFLCQTDNVPVFSSNNGSNEEFENFSNPIF